MAREHEELIVGLFDRELLKFGDFLWTTKSGRSTPIYYNQRPITSINFGPGAMRPLAQRVVLNLAVNAYVKEAKTSEADHIYGIPQSSTHLMGMVALRAEMSSLWGRVTENDYGEHNKIEGFYSAGQSVLQFDDVVTDAGSKLDSASGLALAGLQTEGFVVMFDRQEGGTQTVEDAGYSIRSVFSLSEAVAVLEQNKRLGSQEIGWVVKYHEDLQASGVLSTFTLG